MWFVNHTIENVPNDSGRNVNFLFSLPVLIDISYIIPGTGGIYISLNLLLLSECIHTRIASVLLAQSTGENKA